MSLRGGPEVVNCRSLVDGAGAIADVRNAVICIRSLLALGCTQFGKLAGGGYQGSGGPRTSVHRAKARSITSASEL